MKKNNIYLATKLYSFFDRRVSVVMYNSVFNSKKFSDDNIYLPFKDSNMKVSRLGNVAKSIFEAEIKSLNNTDVFITRLDGTSYDAGVGFEIGYCLAKKVPLYIFNTDFYKNKLSSNIEYKLSPIIDQVANIFKYEYINNSKLTYENELNFNIKMFSKFVTEILDNINEKIYEYSDNDKKYDIFIDFSGLKYEWNKIIVNKITKILDKNKITYWISTRYLSGYSVDTDLKNLKNCKIYLTCYDENEPDLDSSILQGFAYYNKLNIIGYESNPVKYYVEGEQEFGVTLMLEQSCTILTKSIEETIKVIINNIKYN